jgi:hypothetical protein
MVLHFCGFFGYFDDILLLLTLKTKQNCGQRNNLQADTEHNYF